MVQWTWTRVRNGGQVQGHKNAHGVLNFERRDIENALRHSACILCLLQTELPERPFFQEPTQDHAIRSNLSAAYYPYSFAGLYWNCNCIGFILTLVTTFREVAIFSEIQDGRKPFSHRRLPAPLFAGVYLT